jgi:hypothetical protein
LMNDASVKSSASTLTSFRVAEASDISYGARLPHSRHSSREMAESTRRQLFSHEAMKAPPNVI